MCIKTCCQCLLLILCIIMPPLAVLIQSGCDINFCINILFTLLGGIPGMLHAIYICFYYQPTGTATIRRY